MYKIHLETDELDPKYKEFLTECYFHVFEVCQPRGNMRDSALLSATVVPGMNNPVNLPSGDPLRTTLYVCPHALICPAGQGSASFVTHSEYSPAVLESTRRFLESTKNGPYYAPDVAAMAMYKIGLFVRARARYAAQSIHDDGAAPPEALDPNAPQQKLVEFQIGECCLAVPDLVSMAKEARGSKLRLDLCGNKSGLLESLATVTGAVPSVYVSIDEVLIPPAPSALSYIERTLAPETAKFVERVSRVTEAVSLLEQSYREVFADFRYTMPMDFEQLRRAASSDRSRLYPLSGNMTLFHLPLLVTYGILPNQPLQLPIWYYSLARSDPKQATAEKAAFLRLCMRATANIYGVSLEEVTAICKMHTSNGQASLTSTDVANLAALRDIVSHFLTLPAFMGKYRSDMKFSDLDSKRRNVQLVGTEACDFCRICGSSCSDDCEGAETVTQQQYLLSVQVGPYADSVGVISSDPDDIKAGAAVKAMGEFLLKHYEYISAAGSTTAAFPGIDVHQELSGLNQDDAFTRRDEAAMRTIRRMLYGSDEDRGAEVGFHQYSMLVPCVQMHAMLETAGHVRTGIAQMPEYLKLLEYYKRRASQSEANLCVYSADSSKFVPPAIVLESTFPVSAQMVGSSVYTVANGSADEAVLAADQAAYSVAGALRQFGHYVSSGGDSKVRCKDLHALKIVPAHKDGETGKYKAFMEDRNRYSTGFYRHLCHGVNVTALLCKMDPFLSYTTFMHGVEDRFGVPLEHVALGSLPQTHLMHPKIQHYMLPTFTFVDLGVRNEVATVLARSRVESLLPPICFGSDSMKPLEDYYSDNSPTNSPASKTPLYARVIGTRLVMLEGCSAAQETTVISQFKEFLHKLLARESPGSNEESESRQSLRLFPVFGDKCSFYSLRL